VSFPFSKNQGHWQGLKPHTHCDLGQILTLSEPSLLHLQNGPLISQASLTGYHSQDITSSRRFPAHRGQLINVSLISPPQSSFRSQLAASDVWSLLWGLLEPDRRPWIEGSRVSGYSGSRWNPAGFKFPQGALAQAARLVM
jgi:hypothetical protein